MNRALELREGTVLGQRYRIDEILGRTQHAEIWRALDQGNGSDVALKIFLLGHDDQYSEEMFYREVSALQRLRHPNVVTLLDRGRDPTTGRPYLVEEYMPGGSLAERLAKSDPIGPTNKLDLLLQISRGLLQAHSIGIVHRDIKPSNILLSATQTEAKLADFDISKLIGTIRGSETLGHLFSARYASPEQKASQPVGASSDFYSLALVAIELFAHPGKIPGELAKAPISGVPESFRAATRDLLAASAEAREAIVPEWMRALSEAREDALVTRIPVVVTSRACHALAEQGEIRNATHVRSAITLLDEKLGDRVRIRVESRGGQTYVKLAIRPYLIMCRLSTRAGYVTGLEAIDIQRPLPEIVEREIRGAIASPLRLEFVEATHRLTPSAEIEKCLQDLERQQSKKDRSYAQVRHERGVLDLWKRILEYESELVDKQAGELAYAIEEYHDAQHVLSLKLERAPDAIGIEAGSRITVAGGQGLMPVALGTVRDVGPLELSVDLLPTLEIDSVPANGHIMLDQVERTVAMNRSRYALERIERRKNVNPHLLDHLVPSPTANAAPRSIIDSADDPVQAILSGSDIALVQGPPGTGKTTLICDLIARLLENDPFARILIASQSHVAVDNVIEGLATRRPDISVVRIGREEKIGTISRRWRLEDRCRELAIEVTRRLGRQTAAIADNAPIDEPERELLDEAIQTTNTLAASGWRLSQWSAFSAAVESRDWLKLRPLFRAPQVVDVGDAQRVAHVIAAVELLADRADARRELLSGMGQALADQAREAPPKRDHVLVPESDDKIVDDYVHAVSENPQLLADALVGSVSVVAGTCLGVVARRAVLNQQFDYVIVDEAGKATVLEAMVPLSLGRRVVLVGDQRQLPPTIEAELEEMAEERLGVGREELRKSLFQHLYEEAGDVTRIFLSSQHRMHPDIAEFISQEFYDGLLRSDIGEREMDGLLAPWWAPMVWLSTSAENDRFERASGTSFRNPIELRAVIAALTELDGIFKNREKHGSCGVLTGYRAQLDDLLTEGDRWQRRSSGRLSVEFGTVDAFQGREFDIVIYSITRANVQGRVGFLRDTRRMNVALSRARHSVIVVGDHLFIRTLGRRAGALVSLVEKLSAKGFKSLRPASGI